MLRGAAACAALHPALLQELTLLDIRPDHADTATIVLGPAGAAPAPDARAAHTVPANGRPRLRPPSSRSVSNCISFARSLVAASGSSSRSCRLVAGAAADRQVSDIGAWRRVIEASGRARGARLAGWRSDVAPGQARPGQAAWLVHWRRTGWPPGQARLPGQCAGTAQPGQARPPGCRTGAAPSGRLARLGRARPPGWRLGAKLPGQARPGQASWLTHRRLCLAWPGRTSLPGWPSAPHRLPAWRTSAAPPACLADTPALHHLARPG